MSDASSRRADESRRIAAFGICGGVGSGKSSVAALLAARGAFVVDADRLAHEALLEDAVRDAVVAEFGSEVLGPEGRIERPLLRPHVFGPTPQHKARRKRLESLVHPAVRRRIHEELAGATERIPAPPFAILDVPLLIEGPTAALCDAVVFVDAPDEVRAARTASVRGWTPEEHRFREAAQAPVAAKRAAARFVVLNDQDLEALRARVEILYKDLAAEAARLGSVR